MGGFGDKNKEKKSLKKVRSVQITGLCAPGTLCSPELNPDSPAPMLPHQTKNHLKKKKEGQTAV